MADVTTIKLSRADRLLLRDVVDAIRSLKPEEEVPEGKVRLVEGTYPGADGRVRTVEGGALIFDSKPKEELLEGQYRDADGRLRREGGGW